MNSTVGSVAPLAMFTLDKVKGMQSLLNACYSKACLFEVGSSTICHHNLWAAPFFEAEIYLSSAVATSRPERPQDSWQFILGVRKLNRQISFRIFQNKILNIPRITKPLIYLNVDEKLIEQPITKPGSLTHFPKASGSGNLASNNPTQLNTCMKTYHV